jgi:hypothetical protein
VIAQEVEAVYPELVATDAQGMKGVDYPKLVAVLIEATKTLARRDEGLSERLDQVAHANGALRERNAAYLAKNDQIKSENTFSMSGSYGSSVLLAGRR